MERDSAEHRDKQSSMQLRTANSQIEEAQHTLTLQKQRIAQLELDIQEAHKLANSRWDTAHWILYTGHSALGTHCTLDTTLDMHSLHTGHWTHTHWTRTQYTQCTYKYRVLNEVEYCVCLSVVRDTECVLSCRMLRNKLNN